MDSVNARLVEGDQSSSRKKRKIALIIILIILFTPTITSIISVLIILKHKADSESLLSVASPAKAIRAVCSLTPFPSSCSRSLLDLQSSNNSSTESKISPSQIFSVSLNISFNELTNLNSQSQRLISKVKAPPKTLSTLSECKILTSDSLRLINQSLIAIGIVPDDEIFKDLKRVGDLKEWIKSSQENLEKCFNGLEDGHERVIGGNFYFLGRLKREIALARQHVQNNFVILEKMDVIFDMFYNPIPLMSVLTNILSSTSGFDFSVVFFPSQYLVLVFLFCLLWRLY